MSQAQSRSLFRQEMRQQQRLNKNRRTVEKYLHRMRASLGRDLSLNQGLCYLTHGRFVVVMEVPETDPSALVFHSCVYQLSGRKARLTEDQETTIQAMHSMQDDTQRAVLNFFDNEVDLCLSVPITKDFSFQKFREAFVTYLSSLSQASRMIQMAIGSP